MKSFIKAFGPILAAGFILAAPSRVLGAGTVMDQVRDDFKVGRTTEAVAMLQQEAARGNPEAQYGLGILYEKGLPAAGIVEDPKQAFSFYSTAAQAGHAPSQNNLGYLYYTGCGTSKNYAEAKSWYEKSAAQGDAMAACNFGNALLPRRRSLPKT